jgi:hypothetical protein
LAPLFAGLQKKTADLIASFSEKEIQVIQKYFLGATAIMREITNEINNP